LTITPRPRIQEISILPAFDARGPHQMAQMTKRLAVKGFDGLNDRLRTDWVTLTIPATAKRTGTALG